MTEVLFVSPFPEGTYGLNETTIEPPLGLAYLASITEQNNIACNIVDANLFRMGLTKTINEIKSQKPKILNISVNLYTYKQALKISNLVKDEFPSVVIILGGPTPTCTPEKTLMSCKADAVVIGEGEEIFDEILKRHKEKKHLFKDIRGVIYKEDGKIINNGPGGLIEDLDKLPFPAYHLLPDLMLYKSRAIRKPVAPLLTSRGCPFQCIYCSKDVFKSRCRLRSPENVIKEIDLLVNEYGVRQLDILDDNFTINKGRTERILDLIIERGYDLYINLQTGVRTEGIDQNIIDKMKKAKVFKIAVGVESADPQILKRIKKQLDLERVLHVVKMAKKAGMKTYGLFMIGLPGDTPKSMQRTIDFAKKMNPNIANFSLTIPFPGTELYEMVKKEGKFLVDVDNGLDAGFFGNHVFYKLGDMDPRAVLKYYKKAQTDFYFRPKKILELIIGVRSKAEFMWVFNTGVNLLKNLYSRR